MAFLDSITNRNASVQQSVAPKAQPETPAIRSVESLPDSVKSQAVEAALPDSRDCPATVPCRRMRWCNRKPHQLQVAAARSE